MVTPQAWHENKESPYLRITDGTLDASQWEIREVAGRPSFWLPGGAPLLFTAKATLLGPPARWNDDPRQALTVRLSGDPLMDWLQSLEDWSLSRILTREEPKTVVKTNVFQETCARAKLTGVTRFFDKDGNQVNQCCEGGPVTCLLGAGLYRMNGLKGITLRVLAIQG
jgi:hypothetical protein